jgi:hypothetical protein
LDSFLPADERAFEFGAEKKLKEPEGLGGFCHFASTNAGRADPELLTNAFDHGANGLEVGIPATPRKVMRVADPVSVNGTLSANITGTSHENTP